VGQWRRKDRKGCSVGTVPPSAIEGKERTLSLSLLWFLKQYCKKSSAKHIYSL